MRTDPVLLLTACVYPNGMHNTLLQDPETRKRQYLEAIDFYLENTDVRIVVCENSGTDLMTNYRNVYHNRLEYITFDGNNYDKKRGKAFGEIKIIEHALKNSKFLKNSDYIIKITGRVKVLNIKEILNKVRLNHTLFHIMFKQYVNSVIFGAPIHWLNDFIGKYAETINEESKHLMETTLYTFLLESNKISYNWHFPIVDGICGSLNIPYTDAPGFISVIDPQVKLDQSFLIYDFYKRKGNRYNIIKYRLKWLLNVLNRKIWLYRKK